MSAHIIPDSVDVILLVQAFPQQLRYPAGIVFGNGIATKPTELIFDPDLTTEEQNTLDELFGYASSVVDFQALNNGWWTWTANEAETNLTNMIFSGKTLAQIEADIDALPATIAGMKTGLKQAAAAIISLRNVVIKLAQVDVFLRNLVTKIR